MANDLSCSKIDNSNSKIFSKNYVLRFKISMNDKVGVEVVNSLQNLCKIVDCDLSLLHRKFKMFVDSSHQFEEISKWTELHHHSNIFWCYNDLLKRNDSGMF